MQRSRTEEHTDLALEINVPSVSLTAWVLLLSSTILTLLRCGTVVDLSGLVDPEDASWLTQSDS